MKKILLLLLTVTLVYAADAQFGKLFSKKKIDKPDASSQIIKTPEAPKVKKDWSKVDVSKRPTDHFILQYGADILLNTPDSITTKGFSRHFNFYFLMDKPFKTDHRYSIAYGLGITSNNIFFNGTNYVDLKATSNTLPFRTSVISGADSSSYKKFKLTTMYVDVPVELRYFTNPENPNHSWKFALTAKAGILLKGYTKGKDLQLKTGGSVYGANYVEKESDTKFLDGTHFALGARIGYGNISINGEYQVTSLLKSGVGPDLHILSFGLTVSGL
jgi:hypothetical protein